MNWKNFWEIEGFKPTLKRCDDGYDLASNLIKCLEERNAFDEKYCKDVSDWSDKWSELVQKSREYGGCNKTWISLIEKEKEAVEKHSKNSFQYLEYSDEVKKWLTENYNLHYVNFYEKKLFQEFFKKAQKEWKESLEKLQKYSQELDSLKNKKESENTKESINEMNDKIQRRKNTLKNMQMTYKQDMIKTFRLAESLELRRKIEFKRVFDDWFTLLKKFNENQLNSNNLGDIYDPQSDLSWYEKNYGPGMEFKIPEFDSGI